MNIAITGVGGISQFGHLPAISDVDEATLTAVVSTHPDRARQTLDEQGFGDVAIYKEVSELAVDEDVDLVIIATPDNLHYEQANACLESGKHVLLEKPLTLEVSEAEELEKLAHDNSLTLATGFHVRSHVGHRQAIDLLRKGQLGEVRHVRVVWAFPLADDSNWRNKPESTKWLSLSAVGSHALDQARWFAGDNGDWQRFHADISNNLWGGPHDETAVVTGQLSNGVTVESTSSVQFGPYNRVEVFCTGGNLVCSGTLGREGTGRITINEEIMDYQPQNPYSAQLQNVIDAINGVAKLNASSATGVRSVKDLNLAIRR